MHKVTFGLIVMSSILSACSGNDGAPGDKGEPGAPSGLSERARHGLAISPVGVNLDGKTGDEIEQIGHGSYLVNAAGGCDDCHATRRMDGTSLFLGGGTRFPLPPSLGTAVHATNLTPDAVHGMKLGEAQFIEALETGKDFHVEGASLMVMPWPVFRWLSTADKKAMYAYLRAIPAVENPVPEAMKNVIPPLPMPTIYDEGDVDRPLPPEEAPDPDNMLRGFAIQPLDEPADLPAMPVGTQALFGRGSYLVNAIGACNDCHTNPMRDLESPRLEINTAQYLSGGAVFEVPPGLDMALGQRRTMASNLTGATHGYDESFSEFVATITQGVRADEPGQPPLGWPMPWFVYRNMTLEDLEAVYVYITTVPRRTGVNDKVTQPIARYCSEDAGCAGPGETCEQATNECVGAACVDDVTCGACQTCGALTCDAPGADSACKAQGI